jgi:hypothetical protein
VAKRKDSAYRSGTRSGWIANLRSRPVRTDLIHFAGARLEVSPPMDWSQLDYIPQIGALCDYKPGDMTVH